MSRCFGYFNSNLYNLLLEKEKGKPKEHKQKMWKYNSPKVFSVQLPCHQMKPGHRIFLLISSPTSNWNYHTRLLDKWAQARRLHLDLPSEIKSHIIPFFLIHFSNLIAQILSYTLHQTCCINKSLLNSCTLEGAYYWLVDGCLVAAAGTLTDWLFRLTCYQPFR